MKYKNFSAPILYKSFACKSESSASTRDISGYYAAFNIVDEDEDIIRKGAFAKSIQERGPASQSPRKIKFLHQHNVNDIVGPIKDLWEDDYGWGFKASAEKTPLGDIVLERYSNGTYNEHSFGYQYVQSKCSWITEAEKKAFECKELNSFEGSVVTFGANAYTPFTGFKGSKEDAQKLLNDELEFLIRKSPNFDYELQMRHLWAKQMSLIEALAATNTKVESKPTEPKSMDWSYITNNLTF